MGIKSDKDKDPLAVEQNNYASKIVNVYIVYDLGSSNKKTFFQPLWSVRIKRVVNLDQLCFGLLSVQNHQKFHSTICFVLLSHHYGFINYFEISDFPFSNIIPGEVSSCNISS